MYSEGKTECIGHYKFTISPTPKISRDQNYLIPNIVSIVRKGSPTNVGGTWDDVGRKGIAQFQRCNTRDSIYQLAYPDAMRNSDTFYL